MEEPAAPVRASAFDLVARQPWAIQPDMLETIADIARRDGEGIEAVEARLGRPLQNTRKVTLRDGVALVPVTGPVFRYANLFTDISGATSLEILARDFTAAVDDPAVKAIVLNIDSPGGQANGIAEFADLVRAAAKPVTAYVDGTAASAAYWIAAAADRVVMSKTAMVGSIGAVVSLDTSKRPGTVEIVSSQSPNKRPDVTTDTGRAQVQALIDSLAQVFVEDVAKYRGVGVDTVLAQFGQGAMFLAADAVKRGMADEIGTLETLIAGLAGKTNTLPASHPTMKGHAMNMEELRAAHPDLCAALAEEGRVSGAAAERERIQAIQAQAKGFPGHDELIAGLVADGKTTGPEAAVQILAAERKKGADRVAALRQDAPAPVSHAAAPAAAPAADDGASVEDRAKAKWESDPKLRAEFGNVFSTYLAFAKAEADGKVKVLGARK